MAPEIRLAVAVEIQTAQHHPPLDRLLEDPGRDRLAVVQDLLGQRNVDRLQGHAGRVGDRSFAAVGELRLVKDRRVVLERPGEGQSSFDLQHFLDGEGQHPLCAREAPGVRRIPEDLGLTGQLQRVAVLEVDEDQAALRIDRDVAERVEHAVARVVRKQ